MRKIKDIRAELKALASFNQQNRKRKHCSIPCPGYETKFKELEAELEEACRNSKVKPQ